MNEKLRPQTQAIVLDEVFPHAPEVIWKALTTGDLISRWLMPPKGFDPVIGNRFTFQTNPSGEWDGVIRCEVLEVLPNERFSFAWRGGHDSNEGYGSKLETVVTFSLSKAGDGTRLHLVHSGFMLPMNDTAYRNMSDGWKKVVTRLDTVVAEETSSQTLH